MRKKLKRKWEIGTGILTLVLIMAFSIMVMLANRGYAMDEVERMMTMKQDAKRIFLEPRCRMILDAIDENT